MIIFVFRVSNLKKIIDGHVTSCEQYSVKNKMYLTGTSLQANYCIDKNVVHVVMCELWRGASPVLYWKGCATGASMTTSLIYSNCRNTLYTCMHIHRFS